MTEVSHPLFRLPAELHDEIFDKMVENDDIIYCHTKKRALSTANVLLATKQFSKHYRAALERRKKDFAVHRASVLIKISEDKAMPTVQTFMHPLRNASRSAGIDLELPTCAIALHLSITVALPYDFHGGGPAGPLLDRNDITAPLKAIINGTNFEHILLDIKLQDCRNVEWYQTRRNSAMRAYGEVFHRLNQLDWRGQNKAGNKLLHGALIAHDRTGTFVYRELDGQSSLDATSDFIQGEILSKPGAALLDFFRAKTRIGRAFVEGPGDDLMPGSFVAELYTGPISKATWSMDFGFVISVDALLGDESFS